ncbi:MAG: DUF3883 domain-containing protein [Rhodocyclaceae bacterium]|nr:DUF3883 domain-containing protein [Rhodocyclaceae bacterium]MDZ4216258.1 DUF3883 domain-containing protein [Rhodocyclaceae bacterium]
MAWSRLEVEATVADYFHMLMLELSGQSYNKSAHRKLLLQLLSGRTDAAVERKHQNISAILIQYGVPYISGYKPLGNYQALLREVVEERLKVDPLLDQAAEVACSTPAASPLLSNYSGLLVDPPKFNHVAREPEAAGAYRPVPQKRDYLAREARNISLGLAGEEFVLNYEHYRLRLLGEDGLADRVEHVSKTKGDGLGYDILSFDANGRERFIEVKTTAFGKETPFFVSRGELRFANEYEDVFHLYRLFDFRREPKLFDLSGSLEKHCSLNPVTYICQFS